MKKFILYKCKVCGNVVIKLVDSKVPLFCCGQMMEEMNPLKNDGATEKHLPCVTVNSTNVSVKVGQIPHPMTEEHYISHIIALTDKGYYVRSLFPNEQPQTDFVLGENEKLIAVYSLCNLHGLWVKTI